MYARFIFLIFALLCQQMAPAKQMKVLQEFQKQSAQMDMTVSFANSIPIFFFQSMHLDHGPSVQTEMMSDAIDDALDNDEAEEETDELTNQVIFFV